MSTRDVVGPARQRRSAATTDPSARPSGAGPSGAVDGRTVLLTLARHEYRAALRSGVLVTLLGVLVVVTVTSVLIAALDYRSAIADYEAYREAAVAAGVERVAPPPLQPLSLLRSTIEYLEILGALVAIVLGYLGVTRERSNGTMPLLLTRPVSPGRLAAGSALGAAAVIATLLVTSAVTAVLALGVIGGDWVGPGQVLKLFLAYAAALVYMMTFYLFTVAMTTLARHPVNALAATLVVWLVLVLVLPQIGDTLDADNQVPGGLFAALGVSRAQELAIVADLGAYERIRTSIEAASVAKHFERFAFAMSDVRDKYRGFTLPELFAVTWSNVMWLVIYAGAVVTAMARVVRRRPASPRGGM